MKTVEEKFWERVLLIPFHNCWEWMGSKNQDGYGVVRVSQNIKRFAHRFSYEIHKGTILPGLEIDHLCRNRGCVNPHHLEAVPHAENVRRGYAGAAVIKRQTGKTHCPFGHPFSGDNLYVYAKNGSRHCRACRQRRMAAYR